MYWPIGPAKAYEQQLPIANALHPETDITTPLVASVNSSFDARDAPLHVGDDSVQISDTSPPQTATESTVSGLHQGLISSGEALNHDDGSIHDIGASRSGHLFATITRTTLTVWQTKPTVILTSISRSKKSITSYGHNVALLLRPDADLVVIQSSKGFLITYSLVVDLDRRAYQLMSADGGRNARRRSSVQPGAAKFSTKSRGSLLEGGGDVAEARLHFRMVIRLDAGISKALALDNELVVITKEPAAVQCIRWSPDRAGAQFSTELLSDMTWLEGKKTLADVVYDRPMNLFAFVSEGGRAYAVQRISDSSRDGNHPNALFDGHLFHEPNGKHELAVRAAINSRFSLIALACEDGSIILYNVQNYAGGIQRIRRLLLPISAQSTGKMTSLTYSPDGYSVFTGFENGWMTWSVYGQLVSNSFGCDVAQCQQNGDDWLTGSIAACWVSGGSEVLMLGTDSNLIWSQEFARNAATGCYNPANVARGLLQTGSGLIAYQGDQMNDMATISADSSVWQQIHGPLNYLIDHGPIRASVISPDRRYIAIAGQRGLAHYSLASGRWRTFQDPDEQNDFSVRGGMCWHQHVLITAVETSYGTHELRLYSRELPLENSKILQSITLSTPVVNLSTSGEDSVLVYSYDNTLDHYVIDVRAKEARLTKVGQITLTGVIRSPPRVRAVSWIVPDDQLHESEAAQDVTSASVFFLIDGKLVLLQPSLNDHGELKYDMRVIASNIEYFILARDDPAVYAAINPGEIETSDALAENILKDSLWAFDGHSMKVWPEVQELLSPDMHDRDTSIEISVDFYPLSAPLQKGLLVGAEAELIQRRDVSFSYFRTAARTALFLPAIFRYYLDHYEIAAALRLSAPFEHLSYFSHALEILLHTVLDEEVEKPVTAPSTPMHSRTNTATSINGNVVGDYLSALSLDPEGDDTTSLSLLPTVLTFLSHFPDNLDIILQCTRKTELRSWRTLFAHLPPPAALFEQALNAGDLKTAGGYLLVLQQQQSDEDSAHTTPHSVNGHSHTGLAHTMASPDRNGNGFPFTNGLTHDDVAPSAQVVPQAVRLLGRAQKEGEWDLCKELARFLMALDETGETLRNALQAVEQGEQTTRQNGVEGLGLIED